MMAGEACHNGPLYLRVMTTQRGSCLCGEVAYEVEGALEHTHHCHCTYCRKSHGTPFAKPEPHRTIGLAWRPTSGRAAEFALLAESIPPPD